MSVRQPECMCSICKFDRNGNCTADESKDWCPKMMQSDLATMRQRAEGAEAERDQWQRLYNDAAQCRDAVIKERTAFKARAERAEEALRRCQRLADDGVDDPARPHNVLAHIANTVEAALSSPPADASGMGGERERRLVALLKEAARNVGSLNLDRSAMKWLNDVQAALSPEPWGGPEGEE